MAHLYYDDSHLIGEPESKETCRFCDALFWPSDSDAAAREIFCSEDCEAEAKAERDCDPHQRGDDDGQEYGDPREALRERMERD